MGLAATVVAVVVVAAIASGSSASSSAGDKQNELLSRSTAHAFIIPLYQACMAKGSLEPDSSYMCIKKVALTAKGHSMTPFQIIGVFRDLGVDVNSLNFPPI